MLTRHQESNKAIVIPTVPTQNRLQQECITCCTTLVVPVMSVCLVKWVQSSKGKGAIFSGPHHRMYGMGPAEESEATYFRIGQMG